MNDNGAAAPVPRYALYYAPRPEEGLAVAASQWLGRNAERGQGHALKPVSAFTVQRLAEITPDPRPHRFHGTFNSPIARCHRLSERELLAAVGRFPSVRHRFIVISSCYSGGFVNDLAGPDTVVMTAAAGTVMSYGCGNDSQITNFSRAFYVRAWTDSRPLMQAARAAAQYVHEDETRSGRKHSYPQLSIGASMDEYTRRLESAR